MRRSFGVYEGKIRSAQSAWTTSFGYVSAISAERHSGMREAQTTGAQLRIGESRDSGFDAFASPRNDGGNNYGISYTTILSAMPRSAASFWIGLIASFCRIEATPGASITGPVTWISCDVDRLCTRDAMLTVWPK